MTTKLDKTRFYMELSDRLKAENTQLKLELAITKKVLDKVLSSLGTTIAKLTVKE